MTKLYTSAEIARELGTTSPTVEARLRRLTLQPARSTTMASGRVHRLWSRAAMEALRADIQYDPGKIGAGRKFDRDARRQAANTEAQARTAAQAPVAPTTAEVTQAEALLAIATALTKLADAVATLKPTVTESPFKDLKFPTIQPPAIQPVPNLTPKPYSPWDVPAPAPLWPGQPQPKFSLGGVPLDNVPGADNVPQD